VSSVRSVVAAVWVGLYHDIAWTTPVAGLAVRTVAPLASVMTASIIYWLGSTVSGSFDPYRLAYVLVGATLYAHVAAYAWVPTVAIAEGKNLAVFPHIYIAPRSSSVYLAGRTLAAFLVSTTTSVIALASSFFVLGYLFGTTIPLRVSPESCAMLAAALVTNVPASLGLGYVLGAYSLYASKFEWALPSYVAGLLMVFSGALFPPSTLPWPLSSASAALPFTQFIDAARQALIYGSASAFLVSLSYSTAGGAVFLAVGLLLYRASERRARRDGVIDRRLA
jgi:ABC-type polysaccharide/polyol phosphate export permease